jgi:quercetin dioxygenase-like cupin family protein
MNAPAASKQVLRLYVDGLPAKSVLELPAAPRFFFVRDGDAIVRCNGAAAALGTASGLQSTQACQVEGGAGGATLLRWELVDAGTPAWGGPDSRELIARGVDLPEAGGYLMRADRVDFPLGGIAYTHTHRGPGIRCLLRGTIRVEAAGEVHELGAGGAWFEAGPDPVPAMASASEITGFARVMILPRALKGRSSISYVKPEDADKPKTQKYQVFADEFI